MLNEVRNRIEKFQVEKNKEIVMIRNQNIVLKGKETENMELVRDRDEYEEAMALKIGFYDKKFKDLLENIERKDQIVEKLKSQRCDL